ncbi:hypothetical protein M5K25_019890 [Dendrobium thyrsiflorum]|uniref:Uncharacterized protein n=1 Tax=Dendrobium thyrsiflorum TaxID=117978 RepID=A0ABD0UG63_DENTH
MRAEREKATFTAERAPLLLPLGWKGKSLKVVGGGREFGVGGRGFRLEGGRGFGLVCGKNEQKPKASYALVFIDDCGSDRGELRTREKRRFNAVAEEWATVARFWSQIRDGRRHARLQCRGQQLYGVNSSEENSTNGEDENSSEKVIFCSIEEVELGTEITAFSTDDGGRKDRSRVMVVERTAVGGRRRSKRPLSGDGGRKDYNRHSTEVERTVVERSLSGNEGRKDHSRRVTLVRKTVVWRRRSEGPQSAGDEGRKGCCLSTEVGRIVVGGQRRLERQLSDDGGRKDHTQKKWSWDPKS